MGSSRKRPARKGAAAQGGNAGESRSRNGHRLKQIGNGRPVAISSSWSSHLNFPCSLSLSPSLCVSYRRTNSTRRHSIQLIQHYNSSIFLCREFVLFPFSYGEGVMRDCFALFIPTVSFNSFCTQYEKRVVLVGLTSDQEGDSVKTKRKSETRIFQQTWGLETEDFKVPYLLKRRRFPRSLTTLFGIFLSLSKMFLSLEGTDL